MRSRKGICIRRTRTEAILRVMRKSEAESGRPADLHRIPHASSHRGGCDTGTAWKGSGAGKKEE